MSNKSFFKNAIYKSILSFVSIVVPIIVGPYIARVLDPDLYGIYNSVYTDFQVFLVFASFGIYTYGVREVSKIREDKAKVSQLFTNLFVILLISNFVVGIIYMLYALFTASGIRLIVYMLFMIQIVANMVYIEFVNEALESYKFITIKSVIIKILYLISILLFIKNKNDLVPYTIIICLTVFANNFISFIYAKKQIPFDFSKVKIKRYIKPLLLIVLISNIDMLYGTLDKVLLSKTVSDVSVTLYYIPYYIVATICSIPYAVINVGIPRLAYNYETLGTKCYQYSLKQIVSSLLFLIIPICFGCFVLAKEIIIIYAGNKYMAAIPVLMIASLEKIIISIQSVYTNLVLYVHNKEKIVVNIGLKCGLLNLFFDICLVTIKKLTPITAMTSTAISLFVLNLMQHSYAKNKLNLDEFILTKQNLRYLILGLSFIPISIFIHLINSNIVFTTLVTMFVCAFLYVGVLYYTKDENLFVCINKIKGKIKRKC